MRDAEEIPHIVKPLRSSACSCRIPHKNADIPHVFAEFRLVDAEVCRCCAEFRMVDAEI